MNESAQITEAKRLPQVLDAACWDGGVRIVLQGSMRAIVRHGRVDMESGWRADVFYGKGRRPSFVLVAETPSKVLHDLAALTESMEPSDG